MPRLTPVDWKTLVRIFEKDGFIQERESSSHIIMSEPGAKRPLVIPKYKEIGVDIIKANMKTAGMSRERYFQLLKDR